MLRITDAYLVSSCVVMSFHAGVDASFEEQVSPKKRPDRLRPKGDESLVDVPSPKEAEDAEKSEESSSGEDLSLTVAEMSLDTLESLQPFAVTKKPRRRKKKMQKSQQGETLQEPEGPDPSPGETVSSVHHNASGFIMIIQVIRVLQWILSSLM